MTKIIDKPTLDDVINMLDKSYELIYVDYQSNLEGLENEIQEAIHAQCWSHIDEKLMDWFCESEWQSIEFIMEQLALDIESEWEISLKDAEELLKENFDAISEEIYNRDCSNPLKDLMRNTGDFVAFYDTGYEVLSDSWSWDAEIWKEELQELKSFLKIDSNKYDKRLEIMLAQASYGGRLVIYFLLDDLKEVMNLSDKNIVKFENPMIAIIDTFNGSGDNTDLPGLELSLPLNVENIFLDKTIKYNYTYVVCGMVGNWCECTSYDFLNVDCSIEKISKSNLHAEISVEQEYIKAFNNGECTHGDVDMKRHRNTIYINEFPCGIHCKDCKTFWVD